MREITAAEGFHPMDYEHGITCGWCPVPLTKGNAMRLDITGESKEPWESGPRIYTYACVGCVTSNRIAEEPS